MRQPTLGDRRISYLVWCRGEQGHGNSNHDIGQTLQTQSSEHQNSTAEPVDDPEGTGRGNHVGCSVAAGKNSGQELVQPYILGQNYREVVVQRVNSAKLLHE